MQIRPARPDEAAALAAIAVRAKAHWGYPAEFVARFARSLGLTPEVVAANDVWVAERGSVVVGFYTLLHRGELAVLDDLWLEPEEIGHGLGRLLFEHARDRAAAAGAEVLEWEAEPYALGFYERMGGRRVRMTDSTLGRKLPVMQVPLGRVWPGKRGAR
ncbi:GNAT family N-acetyltransferase [Pseudonocardia sp. H11422]|uniref:GNAT family N-acetyltransferase n=1 Tax=Pseudonocardia sp. H11422 TaxID=2835866 RepID=UPI001BDD8C23|nr:GNAT family N-acetyltransferase [Pseudonocardia sp. H11422]